MTTDERRCDVLVIGGGPAGSTIAALLAARGREVILIEKDRHPRFHIGESLLPLNLPLFDALGVKQEIERIGMMKYGVEFSAPHRDGTVMFDFADAWDKAYPYSYQVRRSEFDHILLKNAVTRGAQVIEGCRVVHVDFLPEGVLVQSRDKDGQLQVWRASFLVDASGRDTFLANHLSLKQRNRKHSSAAVFGHFAGAQRLPGNAEGNISIFWFEHGWFWFIPLSDGTTSVGAVCGPAFIKSRKTDVTTFFNRTIAMCPALAARLEHATLVGSATATGNYSYRCKQITGDRFILLGDAFAFVDPVFSTGVYLAMTSAFHGADAVDACLRDPASASRALRRFEAQVRRGVDSFSWYIYRMAMPAMRNLFMAPRNYFRVQEALLSFLAGDVFRKSPIRSRLFLFKCLYYLASIQDLRKNVRAWRLRRHNVQFSETA